jgi:hypothetical protein
MRCAQLTATDGAPMVALLDRLQKDLVGLSDALTRDYLTHAAPVRHLASQ